MAGNEARGQEPCFLPPSMGFTKSFNSLSPFMITFVPPYGMAAIQFVSVPVQLFSLIPSEVMLRILISIGVNKHKTSRLWIWDEILIMGIGLKSE